MSNKPLVRFEAVSGNIVLGGRQFLLFDVRKSTETTSPRAGAEVGSEKPETRKVSAEDAQWDTRETVRQNGGTRGDLPATIKKPGKNKRVSAGGNELRKNVNVEVQAIKNGQRTQKTGLKNNIALVTIPLADVAQLGDQKHAMKQKHCHDLGKPVDTSCEKEDEDEIQICFDAKRVYTIKRTQNQDNVKQTSSKGSITVNLEDASPFWTTKTSKRFKLNDQSGYSFNQQDQLPMISKLVKITDFDQKGIQVIVSGTNSIAGKGFIRQGLLSGSTTYSKDVVPTTGRDANVTVHSLKQGLTNGITTNSKDVHHAAGRDANVRGRSLKQGLTNGSTTYSKGVNPATEKDGNIKGCSFKQGLTNEITTSSKDVHPTTGRNIYLTEVSHKQGLTNGSTTKSKDVHPATGKESIVKWHPFKQRLTNGITTNSKDVQSPRERNTNVTEGSNKQGLSSGTTINAKGVLPATQKDINREGVLGEFQSGSIFHEKNVNLGPKSDINERFIARDWSTVVEEANPVTARTISIEEFLSQSYQSGNAKNVSNENPAASRAVNAGRLLAQGYSTESLYSIKDESHIASQTIRVGDRVIQGSVMESPANPSYVIPENTPTESLTNVVNVQAADGSIKGSRDGDTTSVSSVAFCTICQVPWRSNSALHIHHQNIHLKFECRVCASQHSFQVGRIRHTTAVEATTCFQCAVIFADRDALKDHLAVHKSARRAEEESSTQKQPTLNPVGNPWRAPITCGICGVALESKADRNSHMSRDHGFKFACGVCFERFETLVSLSSHENLHSGRSAGLDSVSTMSERGRVLAGCPDRTPEDLHPGRSAGLASVPRMNERGRVLAGCPDRTPEDLHSGRSVGLGSILGISERGQVLAGSVSHAPEDLHSGRSAGLGSVSEMSDRGRVLAGCAAPTPEHLRGCAEPQPQQLGSKPEGHEETRMWSYLAHAPEHVRGCGETQVQQLGSKPETHEGTRMRSYLAHAPEQHCGGNPPEDRDSKINYMCNFCDQLFGTWHELTTHRQNHSRTTCFLCMTSFSTYKEFNSHISLKSATPYFDCTTQYMKHRQPRDSAATRS